MDDFARICVVLIVLGLVFSVGGLIDRALRRIGL